jgi:hypothetical protein
MNTLRSMSFLLSLMLTRQGRENSLVFTCSGEAVLQLSSYIILYYEALFHVLIWFLNSVIQIQNIWIHIAALISVLYGCYSFIRIMFFYSIYKKVLV